MPRSTAEEKRLANLLKQQLGPISWAQHFARLLELRGVLRTPGPKGKATNGQVTGGISATVALIAEEFGVPRRTAFARLQWARDLEPHPSLADAVDRGELSIREALRQIGNGHSKPDLGNGVSHPARFSDDLLPVFAELLEGFHRVLDPFAGTGRIHELHPPHDTVGIEIEPEWASLHPRTRQGNALRLRYSKGSFDAVCTSPTFGDRHADSHDASDPESRRSYTHDLGHELHRENTGRLHWGDEYRESHEVAWKETVRVLRRGGRFVLDIKDHYREGVWQDVATWHINTLLDLGLELVTVRPVLARGMGFGANRELRSPAHLVVGFDK